MQELGIEPVPSSIEYSHLINLTNIVVCLFKYFVKLHVLFHFIFLLISIMEILKLISLLTAHQFIRINYDEMDKQDLFLKNSFFTNENNLPVSKQSWIKKNGRRSINPKSSESKQSLNDSLYRFGKSARPLTRINEQCEFRWE